MILAALMLAVIGGLAVAWGPSPLAAQTTGPSATRSIEPPTVVPGGTVTVTIAAAGFVGPGRITENLPDGFDYVTGSAEEFNQGNSDLTQGVLAFNVTGAPATFTYEVTASSMEGSHDFSDGTLRAAPDETAGIQTYNISDGSVTVSADTAAATPTPTPEPTAEPLDLPNFDALTAAMADRIFTAGAAGNNVEYTAASGDDDAKIAVRISPGEDAIINIDLGGITVPSGKQVNFSLTDGDNLDFRIAKTGDDTAKIVVKDGVELTQAMTHNFQLVVNEFKNAPANTEDIDVEVTVVIDNAKPVLTSPPPSGTVEERKKDVVITTFSASDINNQVLAFEIVPKVEEADEDADADEIARVAAVNAANAGASAILSGLDTDSFRSSGVLKTKDEVETPVDQPDFVEAVEDDPATTDVDESMPDNVHVFTITVSDGTLDSDGHDFTLTVTDVVDPARGQELNFEVPESQATGEDNSFGSISLLNATGNYEITEQIDGDGVRKDSEDSLFGISTDGDEGKLYLKAAGSINFEDAAVSNNYTLAVMADGADADLVTIMVTDVNEAPEFSAVDDAKAVLDGGAVKLYVLESADEGEIVKVGQDAGGNPATAEAQFEATDEDTVDAWDNIAYDLWIDDDGELVLYAGADALVNVDSTGHIKVNKELDTDADESVNKVALVLRAVDADDQGDPPNLGPDDLHDALKIEVNIIDTNVAPEFDAPSRLLTHASVSEGATEGTEVHRYRATDEDGDQVEYRLRDQDDAPFFTVEETENSAGEPIGILRTNLGLDYEMQTSHTVEIQAFDTDGDTDEIVITVDVTNVNDNDPTLSGDTTHTITENTGRDHVLGTYSSTDADGDLDGDGKDVTFGIGGDDAKSFRLVDIGVTTEGIWQGELRTVESLDADSNTPCAADQCNVMVIASDGERTTEMAVRITVLDEEDSVSTLTVTKANPVPGPDQGDENTALDGTKKELAGSGVPERPGDLPATSYHATSPVNFVETEWANWGTVLLIEVTARAPDADCGVAVADQNNNQCVVVTVKSDSAGDTVKLAAYRTNYDENTFAAAVMLVELEAHASNYALDGDGDEIRVGIYKHQRVRNSIKTDNNPALQVPRLYADEEDEIEIEFGNLRADVEVENEPPEITNFAPEHEDAFDDPDVDYTFTVSDDTSGLPEPQDLPDLDGNDEYMPVVGLVSDAQCERTEDGSVAHAAIHIHEDLWLDCGTYAQDGEYIASEGGFGFAPIRDDKDFDEIDDGFDVETTLVLVKNQIFYVTYIACDNAGNCTAYDPDGNDDEVELAEITIDTELPHFVEARTGVKWDTGDNKYDDDRSFIQVIFDDLTPLNDETVETDDFVVEGHNVIAVHVFSPDTDDTLWGDENSDGTLDLSTSPTRFANGGPSSAWGTRDALYRMINRTVFLELEDELLADEEPDVTVVPNGIEDKAGNEQDDGDQTADDWIAPAFTIVSIIAQDTPEGAPNQLAGDGDEVLVTVTSDERLDQTRPDVDVRFVDAGAVNTGNKMDCTKADGTDGKRKRGEIFEDTAGNTWADCVDNDEATGDDLNNHVEKVTNTEWVITVVKPKATGYYNFYISGDDRSKQKNNGSEGVSPGSIVTDFFDSDGDVNADDAVYWEADINLPNPNVRVSGVAVTDNEASVEFRSPLFVEIDFTQNHWGIGDCEDVDESEDRLANCMNENGEYAEDNFDAVVITQFMLDDVDVTDSVRTTDDETFLVSLESISIGDHTVTIQAMDEAGNVLEDALEIDFEVNDRDPFTKRLSPGWNLVSLPGEPADSSIDSVLGPGVEVRTVYTYNPVVPGGWMVAVRETLDSDWQGDLTEITSSNGYWILSDAIQDWDVSIPRLSGGASGTGTPIQPPVIPLYAGWNLIPVTDISGNGEGGDALSADVYLQSLDDGLDLARVLGYDTITNQWTTVLDPDMQMNNTLVLGKGYWVFVREAASLVPSGYVAGASSD